MEQVILVDENDSDIGVMEKMEAHGAGRLHRAFSLFVFNSQGKLLVHKRADAKYHSGGLWTNTCCGHQRPGETLDAAVHRRLAEEMGFDCELKEIFTTRYKADMNNGAIEHEIDHVFIGTYDGDPVPDPAEISAYAWVDQHDVIRDINKNPAHYTYWFKLLLENVTTYRNQDSHR